MTEEKLKRLEQAKTLIDTHKLLENEKNHITETLSLFESKLGDVPHPEDKERIPSKNRPVSLELNYYFGSIRFGGFTAGEVRNALEPLLRRKLAEAEARSEAL